jgi:hypothetical protein
LAGADVYLLSHIIHDWRDDPGGYVRGGALPAGHEFCWPRAPHRGGAAARQFRHIPASCSM